MYFSELEDNYSQILILADPETELIMDANKCACTHFGYTKKQFSSMTLSDLYLKDKEVVEEDIILALNNKRNSFHYSLKCKNGDVFECSIDAFSTVIGGHKYLVYTIAETLNQILYSKEETQDFDESDKYVFILDHSNKITRVNKNLQELFNIKEVDIVGKDPWLLLKHVNLKIYECFIADMIEGKPSSFETDIVFGSIKKQCTISGFPKFFRNNYFGSVIYLEPFSASKSAICKENDKLVQQVKNLKKIDTYRSEFMARMSHDMRTPMNAIIGFSNYGMEEIEDSRAREYFTHILDSGEYLLSLINDILDVQRLEKNAIKFDSVITTPQQIINTVRSVVQKRADEKDLVLVIKADERYKDFNVKVDRKRIEQIIINLLNNSIKYSPAGSLPVEFRINVLSINEEHLQCQFIVKDHGVGMSTKFQKIMFEPFTTEINSQMKNEGGSGLGLSISKSLVEALGGNLVCHSELGKGTSFEFSIFMGIASEDEIIIAERERSLLVSKSKYINKKILVADDVELNVIILKKMLSVFECVIDVASNGKEAVELAKNNNYDCILMDIRMPIMSGIKATEEIRKFDSIIPIIAVSANAYKDDKEISKKVGMDDYIVKPIKKVELYKALSNAFSLER